MGEPERIRPSRFQMFGLQAAQNLNPMALQIRRAGHPAARQADRRRAPRQCLGQGIAAPRSSGEEPGQESVPSAHCASWTVDRRVTHDNAVTVDQHGALSAEAGQDRPDTPGSELGRGVDDIAQRGQCPRR